MLTITEANGISYSLAYAISGDRLTLTYDAKGLASRLEVSRKEERTFFEIVLKGVVQPRVLLRTVNERIVEGFGAPGQNVVADRV